MSDSLISELVSNLAGCATFEEAAACAASALAGVASAAIEGSAYADRGRVLQGVVHLRPADGYRHLAVVDVRDGAGAVRGAGAAASSSLSSATAWRWVSASGGAVSIDVTLGTAKVAGRAVAELRRAPEAGRIEGQESQIRWLGRDVTHVYVLPLRAPGGAVDGMIALEAECRPAIGKAFVWEGCDEQLALLASLAAPYLLALPARAHEPPDADAFLPVVGASMRPLVTMLRAFAAQDETILLSGPTGAGKSRLARWCHERAGPEGRPFETLELSGVPEGLQMAHLFGWKKGAFSDAVQDTPGAVARAEGGTLFLDEIDKLSLAAQAGLLRVLEERRYRPLGDVAKEERRANVRFVVGTNVDLQKAVAEGRFREDLYYRVNVLPVRVPPLRERADEVCAWADYMLERRRGAGRPARFAEGARRALAAYPWPGNLRQLDNIVRRAYALSLLGAAEQPAAELSVDAAHVERALALEGGAAAGAGGRSLVELMALTAEAFVAEAERKQAKGQTFDLDLAEALRGFALKSAAERLGDNEKALRLLGKASVLAHRNDKRFFEKEFERVEAFRSSVEDRPPPEKKAASQPPEKKP